MRGCRSNRGLAVWLAFAWSFAFLVGPGLHLGGHTHSHGQVDAVEVAPALFTLGPDDVFALPRAPTHEAAPDHTHGGDDPSHLRVALLPLPALPRPALLPGRPFQARPGVGRAGHRPGWWAGAPARGPPA